MCVMEALVVDQGSKLFGADPFGTRAREKEEAKNLQERNWSRQDAVRNQEFTQQKDLAKIGQNININRTNLGAPSQSKTNQAY